MNSEPLRETQRVGNLGMSTQGQGLKLLAAEVCRDDRYKFESRVTPIRVQTILGMEQIFCLHLLAFKPVS